MKGRTKILIVDDESIMRESLYDWLGGIGYEVVTAGDGKEALRIIRQKKIKIMFADLIMPGMDGIELMKEARTVVPTISTVIITAHGTIQTAITAIREGAYDYIEKPFCPEKVELLIKNLVEHQNLIEENISLRRKIEDRYRFEGVVAKSPKMLKIFDLIKTVAPTSATVLIIGGSGTGKEVIARAIYRQSQRRNKPFIVTSCAALPESLLESELFGHEKGSFTGAVERKKGKFEAADKGTLFLDEIGEIDANTQIHLLRALEEKKITRIGSNEEMDVDVRIIAATSRNLKTMIEQGKFREDLYYRLNVIPIETTPLRERVEDIEDLIYMFIAKYTKLFNKYFNKIDKDVVDLFKLCKWKGNVRELENTIEFIINMLDDSGVISMSIIPLSIIKNDFDVEYNEKSTNSLENLERNEILKAINLYGNSTNNKKFIAKKLGVSLSTLYRKMEKHKIR